MRHWKMVVSNICHLIILSLINVSIVDFVVSEEPTPIVMWHGMGDSCCSNHSLRPIELLIQKYIPGVYVKSVRIGKSLNEDIQNSFRKDVNMQVREVCDLLARDKELQDGYHAIGFSQGALFLRAVAQRCPHPPMLNLISMGGPHQGIFGLPNCGQVQGLLCIMVLPFLQALAYTPDFQKNSVQAQYWHDPIKAHEYKSANTFLADINNEFQIKESYKNNLKKLRNFVMVKFEKDEMIVPRISQWFGFFVPGQAVKTQTLNQSRIYTEDQLGLREMDRQGKLHFLSINNGHMRFDDAWLINNIIKPFLN